MTAKKLQSEIDKKMKEMKENIEEYDGSWEQLQQFNQSQFAYYKFLKDEGRKEQLRGKKHAIRTTTLELMDFKHVCDKKASIEGQLDAALRKLHRISHTLKDWLRGQEVRDKDMLSDALKEIELRYKRGKVYYKKGKASDDIESEDSVWSEHEKWIREFINAMASQIEKFEADIEGLTSTVKKKKKVAKSDGEKVDSLKAFVEFHKMHTKKLERLLRIIRNEGMEEDDVHLLTELKDHLEEYIHQDKANMTVVKTEEIYLDIPQIAEDEDEEEEEGGKEGSVSASALDTIPEEPANSTSAVNAAKQPESLQDAATTRPRRSQSGANSISQMSVDGPSPAPSEADLQTGPLVGGRDRERGGRGQRRNDTSVSASGSTPPANGPTSAVAPLQTLRSGSGASTSQWNAGGSDASSTSGLPPAGKSQRGGGQQKQQQPQQQQQQQAVGPSGPSILSSPSPSLPGPMQGGQQKPPNSINQTQQQQQAVAPAGGSNGVAVAGGKGRRQQQQQQQPVSNQPGGNQTSSAVSVDFPSLASSPSPAPSPLSAGTPSSSAFPLPADGSANLLLRGGRQTSAQSVASSSGPGGSAWLKPSGGKAGGGPGGLLQNGMQPSGLGGAPSGLGPGNSGPGASLGGETHAAVSPDPGHVEVLIGMGFPVTAVTKALVDHRNSLDDALNQLIEGSASGSASASSSAAPTTPTAASTVAARDQTALSSNIQQQQQQKGLQHPSTAPPLGGQSQRPQQQQQPDRTQPTDPTPSTQQQAQAQTQREAAARGGARQQPQAQTNAPSLLGLLGKKPEKERGEREREKDKDEQSQEATKNLITPSVPSVLRAPHQQQRTPAGAPTGSNLPGPLIETPAAAAATAGRRRVPPEESTYPTAASSSTAAPSASASIPSAVTVAELDGSSSSDTTSRPEGAPPPSSMGAAVAGEIIRHVISRWRAEGPGASSATIAVEEGWRVRCLATDPRGWVYGSVKGPTGDLKGKGWVPAHILSSEDMEIAAAQAVKEKTANASASSCVSPMSATVAAILEDRLEWLLMEVDTSRLQTATVTVSWNPPGAGAGGGSAAASSPLSTEGGRLAVDSSSSSSGGGARQQSAGKAPTSLQQKEKEKEGDVLLSLREGDQVEILHRDPSGWSFGRTCRYPDAPGWFPDVCVASPLWSGSLVGGGGAPPYGGSSSRGGGGGRDGFGGSGGGGEGGGGKGGAGGGSSHTLGQGRQGGILSGVSNAGLAAASLSLSVAAGQTDSNQKTQQQPNANRMTFSSGDIQRERPPQQEQEQEEEEEQRDPSSSSRDSVSIESSRQLSAASALRDGWGEAVQARSCTATWAPLPEEAQHQHRTAGHTDKEGGERIWGNERDEAGEGESGDLAQSVSMLFKSCSSFLSKQKAVTQSTFGSTTTVPPQRHPAGEGVQVETYSPLRAPHGLSVSLSTTACTTTATLSLATTPQGGLSGALTGGPHSHHHLATNTSTTATPASIAPSCRLSSAGGPSTGPGRSESLPAPQIQTPQPRPMPPGSAQMGPLPLPPTPFGPACGNEMGFGCWAGPPGGGMGPSLGEHQPFDFPPMMMPLQHQNGMGGGMKGGGQEGPPPAAEPHNPFLWMASQMQQAQGECMQLPPQPQPMHQPHSHAECMQQQPPGGMGMPQPPWMGHGMPLGAPGSLDAFGPPGPFPPMWPKQRGGEHENLLLFGGGNNNSCGGQMGGMFGMSLGLGGPGGPPPGTDMLLFSHHHGFGPSSSSVTPGQHHRFPPEGGCGEDGWMEEEEREGGGGGMREPPQMGGQACGSEAVDGQAGMGGGNGQEEMHPGGGGNGNGWWGQMGRGMVGNFGDCEEPEGMAGMGLQIEGFPHWGGGGIQGEGGSRRGLGGEVFL